MQNDLISRSALIEALREEDKKYSVSVPGFMIAMRVIDNQPTAYDVEKVVEQVHDKFENYLDEIIDNPEKLDEVNFLLKQNKEICNLVRNGGKE